MQAEDLDGVCRANAEGHSSHPISLSLQRAYKGNIDLSRGKPDVEELPGHGVVSARVAWPCGALAGESQADAKGKHRVITNTEDAPARFVHVAIDGRANAGLSYYQTTCERGFPLRQSKSCVPPGFQYRHAHSDTRRVGEYCGEKTLGLVPCMQSFFPPTGG